MYLVRNVALAEYEEFVKLSGGQPNEILSKVGLQSVNISDPMGFISYPCYNELLEKTANELNKPLFGLLFASTHDPGLLGTFTLGFYLQENLKLALDYLLSHLHLIANGLVLTVRQINDRISIEVVYRFECETQLRQSSCQHIYNYLTSVQVDNIDAIKIHLRQPRPPTHEQYYSHVCFSADFDGVSFPAEWLMASLSSGRELMLQFVDKHINRLNDNFPRSYSEKVSSVVNRLLREGQCTMTQVANVLGSGVRSLQLKLQEEGRSYSQILQECRIDLAYQLLQKKHIRVTDVAFELGFSDVSTFSRKFKSWTGFSPLQWQKMQQKSKSIEQGSILFNQHSLDTCAM
ncbi:AraC family transcriptional regulator [Aeromonas veronii]|nr:AraC family transcriptional regulator [Aeromonas veronii]